MLVWFCTHVKPWCHDNTMCCERMSCRRRRRCCRRRQRLDGCDKSVVVMIPYVGRSDGWADDRSAVIDVLTTVGLSIVSGWSLIGLEVSKRVGG
jgi:hypothetical protein